MISFGGIVRHDGELIPKEWSDALASTYGSPQFVINHSAVFVEQTPNGSISNRGRQTEHSNPTSSTLYFVNARIDDCSNQIENDFPPISASVNDLDKTKVIQAYERWGPSCVEHLTGDFAIARWDPELRQLYLAKDALGVVPLYFYTSPLLFAFSTDLRALLALPFISKALNDIAIADYLEQVDSGDAGKTFYTEIHRLPAAHYLILTGTQYQQHCYWSADSIPSLDSLNDDEYARRLRDYIISSIESRLRDAKKAAIYLSGGIDSSAIACIAARHLKQRGSRLLALCSVLPASHDGPESDERKFIEAVLAQEDNIDVVWIEVPIKQNIFSACTTWFNILGQPFYSNVSHIEEILAQVGREHGVDVVLSGFGGDFFASAPAHQAVSQMLFSKKWRIAVTELGAIHNELGVSWLVLLKRHVFAPMLPKSLIRRWRATRAFTKESTSCLNAKFSQKINSQQKQRIPARIKMSFASTHELMQFIVNPGHIEQPLSSLVQTLAQEFSQSLRFPLLDLRIIEFMLSVPIEQLHRNSWPRNLFRKAMQDILPEMIRLRRDKGGAFDPAIMSRIAYGRDRLPEWTELDDKHLCWKYIDRDKYIEALTAVEPTSREKWKGETFQVVIMGGLIARFIEWHQSNMQGKR
jgi:asparagine synthase (glutamine-hydrolysing)